jgi:hypothetical protein
MGRQITNQTPQRFVGGNVPFADWDKFIFPAISLTGQSVSEFIRDALMDRAKAILGYKIPLPASPQYDSEGAEDFAASLRVGLNDETPLHTTLPIAEVITAIESADPPSPPTPSTSFTYTGPTLPLGFADLSYDEMQDWYEREKDLCDYAQLKARIDAATAQYKKERAAELTAEAAKAKG